jgi:hypothetical protein
LSERKLGPVEAQIRALRERRYKESIGRARAPKPEARKAVAVEIVKAVMAKPPKKRKAKKSRRR